MGVHTHSHTIASPAAPAVMELAITGMSCGNCARHVTEALQGVPGVAHAAVTLETTRATVRWTPEAEPDVEALVRAVKAAGYEAAPVTETAPAAGGGGSAVRTWGVNALTGIIPTVLLMLGEWVFGWGMAPWFRWLSFFLALIVQTGPGAHFYRGAWRQAKAGSSNMDTLVALGSTTAFAYSAWALFSGQAGHLYFMEAAAIITLISLGHWVEARVNARASSSLRALLNLAPTMARRRNADGTESEVPVAELRLGDTVVLKPGDHVPTDGEVIEGGSAFDESMLTGESVPADKSSRDPVYAGTVNLNGRLLARVTATGQGTALAHIIAAVERAQNSRASIQRLGDRVSSIFVPVVVAVALATGLWWGLAPEHAHQFSAWLSQYLWAAHPPTGALAAAFITAAAVLIVACPCAMGLATPAAIMAGSNAAAERGILIRDAVALEKAGQITAVIFDKTGTLTSGKPAVERFEACDGAVRWKPEEKVHIAAALARRSNHPLSQAVAKLSASDVRLAEWQEVRGAGVQGKIADAEWAPVGPAEADGLGTLRLGALKWLQESGVDLASGETLAREWAEHGATVLGFAAGPSLLGLLAMKDTVKPRAREVIERLHRHGLKTYLLTGDNPRTAASIARQAGIPADHVFAEVRPEQKAAFVEKLQREGERVAFVGDGINDAPALEQADLGIAVARASDIAREAADMILLKSEIEAVPESLGLARATLRTIKQNLFWAFFYNAASIPLAALGFMSPVLCAAAMGFSDLIVIGNALRLRRWRLKV